MNYLSFVLLLIILSGCNYSQNPDQIVAIQIQDRNGMTETINASDRLESFQQLDFLSCQPYKKVLRVFKNQGKNQSKITTYHPNGNPWQYLEAQEMRAFGAYKEWFANGQLKIEATVIGGTADVALGAQQDWLFEGLSKVWDEQGNLIAEIPYTKGELEGLSLYFYPSGLKQKEVPFSKNVVQGSLVEYHSSGAVLCKTEYKHGVKNGLSEGFYSTGNRAWTEEYSDGLLKTGIYFKPDGTKICEVENGGGFQGRFENDRLLYLIETRHGRPEGRWQTYTQEGELVCVAHFKSNQKEGEEIFYYLPSELCDNHKTLSPKLSICWHENKIHGTVQTWYDNGQLESQKEFCRNKKMGPALGWYKDGSLMFLEEYDEEKLIKGHYYKKNQKDPISSILNGNGIATIFDGGGIFIRKIVYMKGKPVDPEE